MSWGKPVGVVIYKTRQVKVISSFIPMYTLALLIYFGCFNWYHWQQTGQKSLNTRIFYLKDYAQILSNRFFLGNSIYKQGKGKGWEGGSWGDVVT